MDQSPQCKHYYPKDTELSENCSNCTRWIVAQCLDHLMLLKRYEIKQMFEIHDLEDPEEAQYQGPI